MNIDKEVLEKAVWKTLDLFGKIIIGLVTVVIAFMVHPLVGLMVLIFGVLLFGVYHSLLIDKRYKMGDWDDRNKK